MKKWIQSISNYKLAILSGVLVGCTYIPFQPWALLICYAPLWWWCSRPERTLKEVFWAGWWTQFTLTAIGFHWIAYTAKVFAYLPWPVSLGVLLLFCAFVHLYIPLALVLAKKFFPQHFIFAVPLLHALTERFYPSIFQWNLGYTTLFAKLPIYHWADTIGFFGISAIILLLNALAVVVYSHLFENRMKALQIAVGGIVIFAVLNLSGYFHGQKWKGTDASLKVAVIQANIGNLEKVYAEKGKGYQEFIVKEFLRLSKLEVQKNQPELLLWPETAFPDFLDSHLLDGKHVKMLTQGLRELPTTLMTGAYSKDPARSEKDDPPTYNALFLVNGEGQSYSLPYRKTHLLAFGEYLPFSETFPILLEWLPFVSNFGRGSGPALLHWPRMNTNAIEFGGQICYESLDPHFSRKLAALGANVLVNVTNDSWFGKTFEPKQHLYMTLARAIETRRPLVRSTNTGVSTVILASGQILEQSPIHQAWSGTFDVPYVKAPEQTWYTRFGHADTILFLMILISLFIRNYFNAKTRTP